VIIVDDPIITDH